MAAPRFTRIALLAVVLATLGVAAACLLRWFSEDVDQRPKLAGAAIQASLGLLATEDARYVREALRLRVRSPSREALLALIRRDHRLVGVAGIGLFFPGTPARTDYRYYLRKYGLRESMGAGDSGDAYMLLYQSEAYNYALTYNRIILFSVGDQFEGN